MSIGIATKGDEKAIALVQELSWLAAYPKDTVVALLKQVPLSKRIELWMVRLLNSDSEVYVFKKNGQIVGFCYVKWWLSSKEAELEALYIKPDYWRQGIGSLLIKHCLKTHVGINQWQLWVLSENKNAQLFYQNIGFDFNNQKEEQIIANTRYLKLGMCKFI